MHVADQCAILSSAGSEARKTRDRYHDFERGCLLAAFIVFLLNCNFSQTGKKGKTVSGPDVSLRRSEGVC